MNNIYWATVLFAHVIVGRYNLVLVSWCGTFDGISCNTVRK